MFSLPLEIWDMILRNLSTKDLINLSRSSCALRKLVYQEVPSLDPETPARKTLQKSLAAHEEEDFMSFALLMRFRYGFERECKCGDDADRVPAHAFEPTLVFCCLDRPNQSRLINPINLWCVDIGYKHQVSLLANAIRKVNTLCAYPPFQVRAGVSKSSLAEINDLAVIVRHGMGGEICCSSSFPTDSAEYEAIKILMRSGHFEELTVPSELADQFLDADAEEIILKGRISKIHTEAQLQASRIGLCMATFSPSAQINLHRVLTRSAPRLRELTLAFVRIRPNENWGVSVDDLCMAQVDFTKILKQSELPRAEKSLELTSMYVFSDRTATSVLRVIQQSLGITAFKLNMTVASIEIMQQLSKLIHLQRADIELEYGSNDLIISEAIRSISCMSKLEILRFVFPATDNLSILDQLPAMIDSLEHLKHFALEITWYPADKFELVAKQLMTKSQILDFEITFCDWYCRYNRTSPASEWKIVELFNE
jgi:hypothetical protein